MDFMAVQRSRSNVDACFYVSLVSSYVVWSREIGAIFLNSQWFFVLLTLFSPVVILHIGSLTPDIPLIATYIAGISGVCISRDWKWALLAGSSVLFRYSGLTVIPLIFVWSLIFGHVRTGIKLTLVSCIPFIILTCHDFWAYGQSHFIHMITFQASESSPLLLKLMSIFAMLAGAVVLPLFSFDRKGVIAFCVSLGFSIGVFSLTNQWSDVFLGFFRCFYCFEQCSVFLKERSFSLCLDVWWNYFSFSAAIYSCSILASLLFSSSIDTHSR